jgi:hypothetical protein
MTAITAVSAHLRPARLLPLLIAAALALIASLLLGGHTAFAGERSRAAEAHAKYHPAGPAEAQRASASRPRAHVGQRSEQRDAHKGGSTAGTHSQRLTKPASRAGASQVTLVHARHSRDSARASLVPPSASQPPARQSTKAPARQNPASVEGQGLATNKTKLGSTRQSDRGPAASGRRAAVLRSVKPVRLVAAVKPTTIVPARTNAAASTAVLASTPVPASTEAASSLDARPSSFTTTARPPETYVLPAVPRAQSSPGSPNQRTADLATSPVASRLESGLTVIALVCLVPLMAVVVLLQLRLLRRIRSLQPAASQAEPVTRYYSMTFDEVRRLAPDMLPALAHHRFCESERHQGRWRPAGWLELEEVDSQEPLMWATCDTCHHQRMTSLTSSGAVAASP